MAQKAARPARKGRSHPSYDAGVSEIRERKEAMIPIIVWQGDFDKPGSPIVSVLWVQR